MAQSADGVQITHIVNGSTVQQYSIIDHGSTLADGNWIVLQGGNAVRIPASTFNYNGVNPIEGDIGTEYAGLPFFDQLNINETSKYHLLANLHSYTVPFNTYPVYSEGGNNNVKAVFYGSTAYANKNLQVMLLNLSKVSGNIDFTDPSTIYNSLKLLSIDDIRNSEVKKVSRLTNSTGDIGSISSSDITELGNLPQGYYALLVLDESSPDNPCILAEAPIIVTKNQMSSSVSGPAPQPGDSIMFVEDQQAGVTGHTYTYAVAIVPEANYTSNINVASDGTISGTSVNFHGLSLDETFSISPGSAAADATISFDGLYRHVSLTKDDLQNADYMKQLAMDELNHSNIAFGTITTDKTSGVIVQVPTTSTMPTGKYVVMSIAVDKDTGNIAAINQTDITLGATYTLELKKGWNLISLPIVPMDSSIGTIFTPAQVNNIWVIWKYAPTDPNNYYGWDYYTPLAGYTPTLHSINYREGYWIYCYNAMTVDIKGNTPADDSITIDQLNKGWNLIGYPSMTPRNPSTLYNDASKVWVVWDYEPSDPNAYYGWDYYTPLSGYTPTLATLQPGKGYWIYLK